MTQPITRPLPIPSPKPSPPSALVACFVLAVLAIIIGALWLLGPSLKVGAILLAALALSLTLGYPEYLAEILAKLPAWIKGER